MDRELQLEILKALSDALSESFIADGISEDEFTNWAWNMNSEIKLKIGENERYFYIRYGATKGVFVPMESEFFPYVIKIPFLDDKEDFDYCEKETVIYQEAQKCGDLLKDFFAPSGIIGRIGNLPVYWMEYLPISEDYNDDSAIKIFMESYDRNREEDDDEIIEEFYSSIASDSQGVFEFLLSQNYSKEDIKIIENFLCKYSINDLHTSNFYYDEYSCDIVLIDYSGF